MKKDTEQPFEFILRFMDVKIDIVLDEEDFSESQRQQIENIVKIASKDIVLDKSYVNYSGTKYKKTFITEKGWKLLGESILTSDYGKKMSDIEYAFTMEAYCLLISQYLYHFLEDLGYDTSGILLEVKDKSKFLIEIKEDTYKEWEKYPGDWRDWKK